MPLDQAWAVGGGAENSVEGARMATYAATNGGRGVILPRDMKVSALPVPGAAVRIVSGGCVSPNTYLGEDGAGQSYSGREISSTDFPVAPTGSAGAQVKYLIWAIHDEQYENAEPTDPVHDPRNTYEWVSTLNGITYPWAPLARLDQPANTSAITNAMLTDIREVANPIVTPVLRARPINSDEAETLTATGDNGEWFPNHGADQRIDVPLNATRAIIESEWLQVDEPAGNAYGGIWVEFGPYSTPGNRQYSTQHGRWNTGAGNDSERKNWKVVDDVYIPKALRGTTQVFAMKGRISYASANSARPKIDQHSSVMLKVTFLQVADPSSS